MGSPLPEPDGLPGLRTNTLRSPGIAEHRDYGGLWSPVRGSPALQPRARDEIAQSLMQRLVLPGIKASVIRMDWALSPRSTGAPAHCAESAKRTAASRSGTWSLRRISDTCVRTVTGDT